MQAQKFATDIHDRATQLVAIDQEVAREVTAAVAGIGSTFPQTRSTRGSSRGGQTRSVDWKTDPPGPTEGPNADDIRQVIEKLPVGDSPELREVRSPQDLQDRAGQRRLYESAHQSPGRGTGDSYTRQPLTPRNAFRPASCRKAGRSLALLQSCQASVKCPCPWSRGTHP